MCLYLNLTLSLSLSISRSFHLFFPLSNRYIFCKWCSSGMLDFNSFQWSARKCDADACNPFSLLYSLYHFSNVWVMTTVTCGCMCMSVPVYMYLANVCCEHVYRCMYVCMWIIRARYGVLLQPVSVSMVVRTNKIKSKQHSFLVRWKQKILPWLKDANVYIYIYKWKLTTTTTQATQ